MLPLPRRRQAPGQRLLTCTSILPHPVSSPFPFPFPFRVVLVKLSPTDAGQVASYTSFLSGGVPGDKGEATGPVPQVQPNTAYNGARRGGGGGASRQWGPQGGDVGML